MHSDYQLVVIFGFVICITLVKQIERTRRYRMWHDLARTAIEKGQPPPPFRDLGYKWRLWDRGLQGGLILIAIGAAMYLAMPLSVRTWGVLPGFIGIAMIFHWLLTGRHNGGDPSNPNDSDRLP